MWVSFWPFSCLGFSVLNSLQCLTSSSLIIFGKRMVNCQVHFGSEINTLWEFYPIFNIYICILTHYLLFSKLNYLKQWNIFDDDGNDNEVNENTPSQHYVWVPNPCSTPHTLLTILVHNPAPPFCLHQYFHTSYTLCWLALLFISLLLFSSFMFMGYSVIAGRTKSVIILKHFNNFLLTCNNCAYW
jgi:hypothetical protein